MENIIEKLTYTVYRYINRGLFEDHKKLFILMVCLKILVVGGKLTVNDVGFFLKSGAGLDERTEKPNPFNKWLPKNI